MWFNLIRVELLVPAQQLKSCTKIRNFTRVKIQLVMLTKSENRSVQIKLRRMAFLTALPHELYRALKHLLCNHKYFEIRSAHVLGL